MKLIWLIALLALTVAPAGNAETSIHAMQVAFHEGRYEEAAQTAASASTADAYALAARALLAKGMCGPGQPPADLLELATTHAQAALEIDPAHLEGRLQLAISRSLTARPLSTRQALRTGYAKDAKKLAESVLADDPDNAYAHGFLAVWHVEVIRRGGSIGAAMMDADIDDARDHYAKAIASMPGDASIHWQFARALAATNVRRFRSEIETALIAAESAPIETPLERVMASRAARLAALMQTQSTRAVQAEAARML